MGIFKSEPISVRIDNAELSLGGNPVLKNVSVNIHKAEIAVIIGANGAGKSSLLSALAGVLPLNEGAHFRQDKHGQTAPITRIGYVMQKPVMLRRSIKGNIDYAIAAAGSGAGIEKKDRAAIRDSILSMMKLDYDSRTPAHKLSQGERQRLAVGRILAMNPGLLMLDEATNSLDHQSTVILENHAREAANEGIPVIWVTHNIDQAKRLADRIIVMEKGSIIHDTNAKEFFEQDLG